MPLAGTFDVLDFAEVLGLLSRREATGRLHLRTASMHGVVWLAEGKAASAEVGNGNGSETRMRWKSQVEDLCFDALRSPKGSFEFQPEDQTVVPAGPRVRLETILAAGRKRVEQWHDVESVIHSFEALPRLADSLNSESLTLTQDKWRVLACIDGRRSVAALARRSDMEVLDFCQLLKPLVESGAVVLEQPEGWLKSLPKVRLEPELPSIPGPAVAAGSPVAKPEAEVAAAAGEGVSLLGGTPAAAPAQPGTPPAPAPDVRARRRRLRGRAKALPAEPAST